MRTHEPFRREYSRGVYVVRHVCDVAVSYYNWWHWTRVDVVEFKHFLHLFLKGHVDGYGPWQKHVASWLDIVDRPICVIRYEDLKGDTEAALGRILEFLGVPADAERVADAVRNNTIERMRQKQERARASLFRSRASNLNVVRQGSVGDWRDWMDEDDLTLVEEIAGPALDRLGYDLHSVEPG